MAADRPDSGDNINDFSPLTRPDLNSAELLQQLIPSDIVKESPGLARMESGFTRWTPDPGLQKEASTMKFDRAQTQLGNECKALSRR